MNIKFMLSGGGMPPFTYYLPVLVNSSQPEYSQTKGDSTKTTKKSEDKEKDKYGDLAKLVNTLKGLPSDLDLIQGLVINTLRAALYGASTALLDSLYAKTAFEIKKALFSQDKFNLAEKRALELDSLTEIAITPEGGLVVYDITKKNPLMLTISAQTYLKNKGKYTPITNQQLLRLRSDSSPKNDKLIDIVNNSTSMLAIDNTILNYIATLGSTNYQTSGTISTQLDKILQGIEFLKSAAERAVIAGKPIDVNGLAVDGLYEAKFLTKDLQLQAKHALQYLAKMLPKNMVTYLTIHSGGGENVIKLLEDFIISRTSLDVQFTPSLKKTVSEFLKDGQKTSKEGDVNLSATQLMVLGYGYSEPLVINVGNSYNFTTKATHNSLVSKEGNPLKTGDSLKDVTSSQQSAALYFDHASFGGSKLNDLALDWSSIKNNNMMIVELPYTTSKSGTIIPNLELSLKLEDVDTIIALRNISKDDYAAINKVCEELKIPPKFIQQDGKWTLNQYDYKRFAIVYANMDKRVIAEPDIFNANLVDTVTDDASLDAFTSLIRKNTNDKSYEIESNWLETILYRGYVFIPVKDDAIQATLTVPSTSLYKLPGDSAEAIRQQLVLHQAELEAKRNYNQAPSLSTLQ